MRYNFFIAGLARGCWRAGGSLRPCAALGAMGWVLVLLGSSAAFIALQFSYGMWLWSSLFFIVALIALAKLCCTWQRLGQMLGWVGGISAAVFIVHPIVRMFMFGLLHKSTPLAHIYVIVIYYAAAALALGYAYSRLVAKLPSPKTVSRYNA